jgi:hypothetical protein
MTFHSLVDLLRYAGGTVTFDGQLWLWSRGDTEIAVRDDENPQEGLITEVVAYLLREAP